MPRSLFAVAALFSFASLTSLAGCSSNPVPASTNDAGGASPPQGSTNDPASEAGPPPIHSDPDAGTTDAANADAGSPDATSKDGSPAIYCEGAIGGGTSCTCVVDPNRPTKLAQCSSTTVPNGFCCAQTNYPHAAISTCQCQPWGCNDTGNGCDCALNGIGTSPSCTHTYKHCCEHLTQGVPLGCACSNFACANGDLEVTSCTQATSTSCTGGTVPVASCR